MTKSKKAAKVPRAELEIYNRLTSLTDCFCEEHLNGDYAELARHAIAALCRKRTNPLPSGRANSWACGVLYAIGKVNFLFDKDSNQNVRTADLCAYFNIAARTGKNKAKQVSEALRMEKYGFEWALPDIIERTGSLYWLIDFNGLAIDARELPHEVQEVAFEKGLIPYIHADKGKTETQVAERKQVLARYDLYRAINTEHQTRLAVKFMDTTVPVIAQTIGLIDNKKELADMDLDDMVHALDLTLYKLDGDGISAAAHDLEGWTKPLNSDERRVFGAMSKSLFSVFEITEKHKAVGLGLRDLFSGEALWLVGRGLEVSGSIGFRLAVRLIRQDDFWITTGASLVVNDALLQSTKQHFGNEKDKPPHADHLAEFIFRSAYENLD